MIFSHRFRDMPSRESCHGQAEDRLSAKYCPLPTNQPRSYAHVELYKVIFHSSILNTIHISFEGASFLTATSQSYPMRTHSLLPLYGLGPRHWIHCSKFQMRIHSHHRNWAKRKFQLQHHVMSSVRKMEYFSTCKVGVSVLVFFGPCSFSCAQSISNADPY